MSNKKNPLCRLENRANKARQDRYSFDISWHFSPTNMKTTRLYKKPRGSLSVCSHVNHCSSERLSGQRIKAVSFLAPFVKDFVSAASVHHNWLGLHRMGEGLEISSATW